ncbi:MAG TPA: hypothetical protein VFO94_10555 [Gammaproteobacteria bacterium]|nr:hypothetical protein [Gammaproteobacteria bacterium]
MCTRAGLLAAAAALLAAASAAPAADTGKTEVDRFTASTVAMTPRDESLRIDVRQWSDDAGRAAAVEALGGGADTPKALAALPTLGYLWRSKSSVGYAIKYAHRTSTPTGQRLTFVTDKRLGAYDLERWAADAGGSKEDLPYSVVELYLNGGGSGDGTLSLAAGVKVDKDAGLVSLDAGPGSTHVLTDAKAVPGGG